MRNFTQRNVRRENAQRHERTNFAFGTKHGKLIDFDPYEGHSMGCAIRTEYGSCDCGCNAGLVEIPSGLMQPSPFPTFEDEQ